MRRRVALALGSLTLGLISLATAGTINPFTSTGALGSLNPSSNVVFDTDDGTWAIGGVLSSGGQLVTAGFNGPFQSQYEVYDFSNISIPSGVTVSAVGSTPLILLAQTTALIDGVVNVNGQNGGNGFMGSGIGSGSGAGGGGGGGGGVIGIFAGAQLTLGSTGQILARGGDGGTGDDPSEATGLGGAGGTAVSGGAAGGDGGSLSAGGMGGMGGSGTVFGGSGGGGGGGAYDGAKGAKGAKGFGLGTDGMNGGTGGAPTLVAGGAGGDGGLGRNTKSTMGTGGAGGNPGAMPATTPKVGGNSTFGGGGGGGGGGGSGADPGQSGAMGGSVKGNQGGGGGGGGGGDCFASATCVVGKGGAGGVGGSGKAGGADGGVKGDDGVVFSPLPGQGAPGAGGAVILGSESMVQIGAKALIDVSGGDSGQGGNGVIVFLGTTVIDPTATLIAVTGTYPGGISQGDFFAGGGGGGGGGGSDGLPSSTPEPSTISLMTLGALTLALAAARRNNNR